MESGVFGVIFISKKGHAGSKCFHRKIKKKKYQQNFKFQQQKSLPFPVVLAFYFILFRIAWESLLLEIC